MIAIIDYGMGNLRSVEKALHKLGHEAEITTDPAAVRAAEKVILPGVGAFGAAMRNLTRPADGGEPLRDVVVEAVQSGRPFLGICLGMQLLLTESEELGCHRGLDLVPGQVLKFDWSDAAELAHLKIPHMGWNRLRIERSSPLFAGVADGAMVYFVHSYYCRPEDTDTVAATTEHGIRFCSSMWRDNVFATQFHPEKSGDVGLRLLDNFARL